jgi:hypothetical protein
VTIENNSLLIGASGENDRAIDFEGSVATLLKCSKSKTPRTKHQGQYVIRQNFWREKSMEDKFNC